MSKINSNKLIDYIKRTYVYCQKSNFEQNGDEYYHYSPAKHYSDSNEDGLFVPKTFGYESLNGRYDTFFNFCGYDLKVLIEEYNDQTLLCNHKFNISAEIINTVLKDQNTSNYEELYFQYSTVYSDDILKSIHVMDELFKQTTNKSMIHWLVF